MSVLLPSILRMMSWQEPQHRRCILNRRNYSQLLCFLILSNLMPMPVSSPEVSTCILLNSSGSINRWDPSFQHLSNPSVLPCWWGSGTLAHSPPIHLVKRAIHVLAVNNLPDHHLWAFTKESLALRVNTCADKVTVVNVTAVPKRAHVL